jgi:L-asparaginase II
VSASEVVLARGPIVESRHQVSAAVCDAAGRLVAWSGDPGLVTYMRSSAKPLQALALIETGAADAFGLTPQEIAVTCASHSGEDVHTGAVRSILAKAGVAEGALCCGTHAPIDRESARRLVLAGAKPTEVYSNCSGKHAGMLAVCQRQGWPLAGYRELDHPLQQLLMANIAAMAGVHPASVAIGVDGCGVPVHGVSLAAMATAFARLASPGGLTEARQGAVRRIVAAMQGFPHMVAGRGRFTTELMQAARPRVVAKSGAEAVYTLGLTEHALGVALKVHDGNSRAAAPAAMSILAGLGALPSADLAALCAWSQPPVRNSLGDAVARLEPRISLSRA